MDGNEGLNYSAVNQVNAAADGNIVCPKCGAMNGGSARFCKTCGCNLPEWMQNPGSEQAAFPAAAFPVKGTTDPAIAEQEMAAASEIPQNEPVSAFAEGLPDWSVEPPQVMVRRKRSR